MWIVSFIGLNAGVYGVQIFTFPDQNTATLFAYNNPSLGTPTIAQVFQPPFQNGPYVPQAQPVAVGNWLLIVSSPNYLGATQTWFYGVFATQGPAAAAQQMLAYAGGSLVAQVSATPS